MAEQRTSIDGKVFDEGADARRHGPGGIWYAWIAGSQRQFPQDVASVFIVMPVEWAGKNGIVCEWTVSRKNHCGARWTLGGTPEAPTLSPSLHWRGFWHGHLRDGRLESV